MRMLLALPLLVLPLAVLAQAAPEANYFKVAWSPDSRTLAFESNREGKPAIYTIGVDGSGLRRITPGLAEDIQPGWSPDGMRIVFASTRSGHEQLYVMNRDGTHPVRLTDAASLDFNPGYSPDGRWIVFQSQETSGSSRYGIHIIRSDGSDRRQLSDTVMIAEDPQWSADGTRITYVQTPIMKPEWQQLPPRELARARQGARQFVSIAADGSQRRAEPDMLRPNPDVSPDGRWIMYRRQVNGVWGIYVREIRSGLEHLVIEGPARVR